MPENLPGSWELEFHKRIVTFLALHGQLVSKDSQGSYDSWWQDYSRAGSKVRTHLGNCEVDAPRSAWKDGNWSTFNGTGEPDRYETGIEAEITCRCGQVAGRRFRYDDGYAALIRAITRGEGT